MKRYPLRPFAYATLLAGILLPSVTLHAQDSTAAANVNAPLDPERIQFRGEPLEMSLADVIITTFRQNLDIEIQMIDMDIAKDDIMAERSIYDPTLLSTIQQRYTDRESTSARSGFPPEPEYASEIKEKNTEYEGRVEQLLPTGATAGIGFENRRNVIDDSRARMSSISPSVTQRAFVFIRQPLLKNLGPNITNAGIRVARRAEEASRARYQQEVIDQTAAVMDAYWDLVFAIRNLEVQRVALESALELERVNEVRVRTGAAPRADLSQAQARVAQRRANVIAAKSQIFSSQDQLLRLMNWVDSRTGWNQPIQPTDSPDLFDLELELNDTTLIDEALSGRPDFKALELELNIAEISRDVARWQRMPQLDAFAEYGLNGMDGTTQDAFGKTSDADYTDYVYGLDFRFPIPNRRARATYSKSKRLVTQAELGLNKAELLVVTEVRAATRQVRTAQESIEASEAEVRAAQETLDAERRRLEVGGSTTFNVLQFQEDLAQAQVNQVRSRVDYQKGRIELERSKGTLLEVLAKELNVELAFDGGDDKEQKRRDEQLKKPIDVEKFTDEGKKTTSPTTPAPTTTSTNSGAEEKTPESVK